MILSTFASALTLAAVISSASPTVPPPTATQPVQSKPSTQVVVAVKQAVTVTVNEGDTLTAIAEANQTTVARLFAANANIANPDIIIPGEVLRIPSADEQLPDRPLPAEPTPVPSPAPVSAPQPTTYTAPAPVAQAPVTSAPIAGCGDNSYANFIYMHESGCRTTAMSANGCYGIGQACPASKLAYCGADYACQNAFFTAYAGKYGGWAGAYAFWVAHGWW